MNEEWLERWKSGHTGWHEAHGNTALHKFWPKLAAGSRVEIVTKAMRMGLVEAPRSGYQQT